MQPLIARWLASQHADDLIIAKRAIGSSLENDRKVRDSTATEFLAAAGSWRSPERWDVLIALLSHLQLAGDDEDERFVVSVLESEVADWESPEFGQELRAWLDKLLPHAPVPSALRGAFIRVFVVWAATHLGHDEATMFEQASSSGTQPESDDHKGAALVGDAIARFTLKRRILPSEPLVVLPYELDEALSDVARGVPPAEVEPFVSQWCLCCWLIGWIDAGSALVEAYARCIEPIAALQLDHAALDPLGAHGMARRSILLAWWLCFALDDPDDTRIPLAFLECWRGLRSLDRSADDDDSLHWGTMYFSLAALASHIARTPVAFQILSALFEAVEDALERMTANPAAIRRILSRMVDDRHTPDSDGGSASAQMAESQPDLEPSAPLSSSAWPFADHRRPTDGDASTVLMADSVESIRDESPSLAPLAGAIDQLPLGSVYLALFDLPLGGEKATIGLVATHFTPGIVRRACMSVVLDDQRGSLGDSVLALRAAAWSEFDAGTTMGEEALGKRLMEFRNSELARVNQLGPLIDRCLDWAAEGLEESQNLASCDCLFAARGRAALLSPLALGAKMPLLHRVRSLTIVPSIEGLCRLTTKSRRTPRSPRPHVVAAVAHEREGHAAHALAGNGSRALFSLIEDARQADRQSGWRDVKLLTAGQRPLATCRRAREATSRAHISIIGGHGRTGGADLGVQLADGVFPSPQDVGSPVELYASCFALRWGQRGRYADLMSPIIDEFTLSRLMSQKTRTCLVSGFADAVQFSSASRIAFLLGEAAIQSDHPFSVARCASDLLRATWPNGIPAREWLIGIAEDRPEQALWIDALLSMRVAGCCPS